MKTEEGDSQVGFLQFCFKIFYNRHCKDIGWGLYTLNFKKVWTHLIYYFKDILTFLTVVVKLSISAPTVIYELPYKLAYKSNLNFLVTFTWHEFQFSFFDIYSILVYGTDSSNWFLIFVFLAFYTDSEYLFYHVSQGLKHLYVRKLH